MSDKQDSRENPTAEDFHPHPDRSAAQRPHQETGIVEEVLPPHMAERLLSVRPENIIRPKPLAEMRKGRTLPSTGWVHAPAHLELLATAQKRLVRCAAQKGMIVQQVERVHACLIEGTKLVVIQPADEDDRSAYEVRRYANNSGAWVNLFTLLEPENLTIETGYKERFDIAYVPKGSLLYPGLVFDLNLPRERRRTKRDRAGKTTGQSQEARENLLVLERDV